MADSALRHPPGRFEIESVLEVELQGQLNQAGATEAGDLSERRAVHRSRRSVPIRVVHDIEELATELDLVPFLDREQAADIHVQLDGARIVEDVTSRVAERSGLLTCRIAGIRRQC